MSKHLAGVTAALGMIAGLALVSAPVASADTFCGTSSRGASVYAGNANTSCQFALNTAEAYHAYGTGSDPFDVYSPATGLTYSMVCTVAGSVCQGGNDALVYLR